MRLEPPIRCSHRTSLYCDLDYRLLDALCYMALINLPSVQCAFRFRILALMLFDGVQYAFSSLITLSHCADKGKYLEKMLRG